MSDTPPHGPVLWGERVDVTNPVAMAAAAHVVDVTLPHIRYGQWWDSRRGTRTPRHIFDLAHALAAVTRPQDTVPRP